MSDRAGGVRMTVERRVDIAGYNGGLTVGELREALEASGAPPSARVAITTSRGDQRDPGGWRLTITWTPPRDDD